MSILKLVLKAAAPLPDIEKFDRYLFIGPHPDDIEIGAGATAAKLAARGKSVCFLICLDGRYGSETIPPEELVGIRKQEALASAKALGVSDVRFYKPNELVRGIAQTVGEFKPDVIFAPDPCVTSECHTDHLNVGNAARRIAYFAPYAGIMREHGAEPAPVAALAYYMTAKANRFVKTKGFLDKQLDAIFACHLSQFPGDSGDAIKLYLKLRSITFGLRCLSPAAEGFRVLGPVHMHCLPEMGD